MNEPPAIEHISIRVIAMPSDTNPNGDIFGGWLMSHMDLAASSVAHRRAHGRVATVAVEGMTFLSPVSVGDEVTVYARLRKSGRTSMHIWVEAWRRPRSSETLVKVTEATFVFVSIGDDRMPRALPPEEVRPSLPPEVL